MRICKSKSNRQHNEQQKKDKRRNSYLQNITHKTKDPVMPSPLKTMGELRCSGRVSSSCSTRGTNRVTLVTILVISHEWGKDQTVFTKSATYPWSFVTQMLFEHIRRSSKYDFFFLKLSHPYKLEQTICKFVNFDSRIVHFTRVISLYCFKADIFME